MLEEDDEVNENNLGSFSSDKDFESSDSDYVPAQHNNSSEDSEGENTSDDSKTDIVSDWEEDGKHNDNPPNTQFSLHGRPRSQTCPCSGCRACSIFQFIFYHSFPQHNCY